MIDAAVDHTREENRLLRLAVSELEEAIRRAGRLLEFKMWSDPIGDLDSFVRHARGLLDLKEHHDRECYRFNSRIHELESLVKQRDRKIALLIEQATCRELKAVAESL